MESDQEIKIVKVNKGNGSEKSYGNINLQIARIQVISAGRWKQS